MGSLSSAGLDGIGITGTAADLAGIDVILTANTANGNGRFGIDSMVTSYDTVIDGGGNLAKKNSAGQCLNIVCAQ